MEGDIVVIKVDPLAYWTKMKGSNFPSMNTSLAFDQNLTRKALEDRIDSISPNGLLQIVSYSFHSCFISNQVKSVHSDQRDMQFLLIFMLQEDVFQCYNLMQKLEMGNLNTPKLVNSHDF